MNCLSCAAAQLHAHHPIYQGACRGCRIRALAQSIPAWESAQAGRITPTYKAALQVLAGEDWQTAHAEVKQERARIEALRKQEQQ